MPNKRAAWHFKANAGVIGWLVALLVVIAAHRFLPVATWLMVHLLLLGAITNAILVWSTHFADAVLRSKPSTYALAGQTARLWLLNAGVATVVVGMMAPHWSAVLAGGIAVGAVVIWHGAVLAVRMRRALPSRFAPVVRYYVTAAAFLPFGAAAGILLARHIDHDRLVIAHVAVNLLGWVGITVIGTLVTLWATMLRTKIVDGADRAAKRALWILAVSVVVIAAAALVAPPWAAAIGAAGYLAGLAVAATPWIAEARRKPPSGYATYSVAAGVCWLAVCLVWLGILTVAMPDWHAVSAQLSTLVGPFAAGFAAQVLLGAMSYLIPVVAGGGPVPTREATKELDRGAAWRVSLVSTGLVVFVLPAPSLVTVAGAAAALVGLASFLPLLARALYVSHREKTHPSPQPPLAERRAARAAIKAESARPGRFAGPAAAAFVVVALAIAGAVALDPAGVGAKNIESAAGSATATGETTTVEVEAYDMRFHPQNISVPAGNRLIIHVTNTDTMVHDLVLDTGATSGRLSPGESASVDAGIVGRDIDGWCSIVGHRQLGMVMQINVIGGTQSGSATGSGSGQRTDGHSDTGEGSDTGAGSDSDGMDMSTSGPSAAADLDFHAEPPDDFTAHDATVPPIPPGDTHHITLTVHDTTTFVAPGVKQTLWTYSADGDTGTMPGPTLHGAVGDTFVITLVNSADMSHSVDFHAGSLAPDLPMRDIAPGESLTYTFTATKSGIWLYHCATEPMSAHIANGMFGAVIIDPPDLAPVDEEYLLISSELYLGPQGGTVDVTKAGSDEPDAWVFNGYVNQYDAVPLTATAGDRVRIWLLDAGPNDPLAFHVVGVQFDTVFKEGRYALRPGNAASGGSQTLALAPSQGGFVEFTVPEAGHYPLINHSMFRAEHGEHGILHVRAQR